MRLCLLAISIICIASCTMDKYSPEPAYATNFERFLNNVRIKHNDEYSITYEYKDVRVDEIAYMAAEYCYNQGQKQAVLHSSQLYKNFSRRATFNCI